MARDCVTHHAACDCREERFRELEAENERLRSRLGRIAELLGSLECWEHPDDPALSVILAEHIHATDEAWEIARGERAVERHVTNEETQ